MIIYSFISRKDVVLAEHSRATDKNSPSLARVFSFLNEIKNLFLQSHASRALTASAFSLNDEFERTLITQMEFFSAGKADKFAQINQQIEATRETMVQNLEKLLMNGEKIELLVTKTEELQSNSMDFRKTATTLKRHFWWKNVKLWIILAVCLVIFIWLLTSIICGFNYKKCSRKKQ